MNNMLRKTAGVMCLILQRRRTRRILAVSAFAYLIIYIFATGDLAVHAHTDASWRWSRDPLAMLFKRAGPFYFEPIALIRLPFVTYLFSPLNLAIALLLAFLVGLNISLSYLSIALPKVCRGRPATGILASLPALLAGSACCGPIILIVLGIQASAALIAFFGLLVPIAIALLLITFAVNTRRIDIDYLQETGQARVTATD